MNESFRPLALTITIWKKARADITIEKKKKKKYDVVKILNISKVNENGKIRTPVKSF